MTKISVLLATNRLNKKVLPYIEKCIWGLNDLKEDTFTPEFHDLVLKRIYGVDHILEPTLLSLEEQKFKDFEFILSHKYPDDVKELLDSYKINYKVVKEKDSIWHNLGDRYHTVANNKNTAFINSKGELIYHIDDLTFFNENLLQEAWDLYKDNKYMTGRTVRCITYDKDKYPNDNKTKLGPNKIAITKNGWIGELKPLTSFENHPNIPMSMFWTCSASVSAEDLLKINGYDELYDGSLTGIDMDAGNRLERVSNYTRVASNNFLYEIDDPTPKNNIRDDVMMRTIWRVNHIRANTWKPNNTQMKRYKRWYTMKVGEIDENWNKFMDVPMYDIKRIQ